jgi:hypothetical protein
MYELFVDAIKSHPRKIGAAVLLFATIPFIGYKTYENAQTAQPQEMEIVETVEGSAENIEILPTVEELKVKDLSLMSNPELLHETFDKLIDEWMNSGASYNNADEVMKILITIPSTEAHKILFGESELINNITGKYDDIYAEAIFGPPETWNDPIKKHVEKLSLKHRGVFTAFVQTYEQTHPYEQTNPSEILSITQETDADNNQMICIKNKAWVDDNSDLNSIGKLYERDGVVKTSSIGTYCYQRLNDAIRISKITIGGQ